MIEFGRRCAARQRRHQQIAEHPVDLLERERRAGLGVDLPAGRLDLSDESVEHSSGRGVDRAVIVVEPRTDPELIERLGARWRQFDPPCRRVPSIGPDQHVERQFEISDRPRHGPGDRQVGL